MARDLYNIAMIFANDKIGYGPRFGYPAHVTLTKIIIILTKNYRKKNTHMQTWACTIGTSTLHTHMRYAHTGS